MRWLTNLPDPRRFDAPNRVAALPGETTAQALDRQRRALSGKVIGPPQATPLYSREELEAQGMVGVYDPEEVNHAL